MKSLENRIKYYELIMTYDDTSKYTNYELPSGYHFEYYKKGDMYDWINIHISSGEFTSIEEGEKIFHDFYDPFIEELSKRCIFIVDDNTNEKVGTATISKVNENGYMGAVDWLAIKEEYQGKHLSKPLISKFISIANNLGVEKILLHTQTTTWLAAKLYLDFGFEPYNLDDIYGWQILKTLTNHAKLSNIDSLNEEDIYDKRNVIIYDKLKDIYGDNFNYAVWYKNGLHNVYVYYNGNSYEYEYFEEDNDIILKEVKCNTK